MTRRRGDAQAGRRAGPVPVLALVLAVAAAAFARPAGAGAADDLEASLRSGESATAVLTRWCAQHALADPPRIVALRDRAARHPAPPSVRRSLAARAGERVAYRRVRLACGARVLSVADNWYLPDHLGAGMNETLETTDKPFGQVVAPLGFHRVTLRADRPRHPAPGAAILRVSAVLIAADGRPFSVVRESYLPADPP